MGDGRCGAGEGGGHGGGELREDRRFDGLELVDVLRVQVPAAAHGEGRADGVQVELGHEAQMSLSELRVLNQRSIISHQRSIIGHHLSELRVLNQRSIRGHQRSSEVIRGHHRSS
jgi:hypothetical protein